MADSAQFLIDIAAEMTGGEDAVARLTQLAAQLSGSGAASELFGTSLAKVSTDLAAAATASTTASEALKTGEQRYAELERAAVRAAKALEAAGQKSTGAVPADLAQRAAATAAALRGEAQTLDELRARATAATQAHTRLTDAHKALEAAASKQKGFDATNLAMRNGTMNVGKMKGAFGALGGPLGAVGSRVTGLVDGMGNLASTMGTGPGALVGIAVVYAAALVAVTAAIGAAIVKTAVWAVGLADVARTQRLSLEALARSNDAFVGLGEVLPSITRQTGVASSELVGLAKSLGDANVSASEMPDALEAVALAEAALGKGEAAKFIEQLKTGKKTAAELAEEMRAKFGGVVAKQLMGLDKQTEVLKRNLGETFGGLKIEPLLEGLQTLVALFDKNTAAGAALKFAFEGVFQPIIDGVTKSIPIIEAFALGFAIAGLKIYIAMKPAIKAVGELLGQSDTTMPDALETAIVLGKLFAATVFAIVGTVAIVFAAVAAAVLFVATPFIMLGHVAVLAWNALKAGAQGAIGFLKGLSLSDIGTSLITGLASGITGAAGKVLAAITGVVTGAINTAKSLLGISSPSKVFEDFGANTAKGFEGGVEGGTAGAQAAMGELVDPPASGGAGGAATNGPVSIVINITGSNADDIAMKVRQVMTEVFEGDLTSLSPQGAP